MNRREMLLSTGALLTAGWVPEVAVANAVLGSGGESRLPAGASRASPEPFHVAFGPDRIGQLHRRIDATRWPTVPFETGWSAGTDDRVLRDLVRYWRHDYDWKRVQSDLNRLPHYRLPVEGDGGDSLGPQRSADIRQLVQGRWHRRTGFGQEFVDQISVQFVFRLPTGPHTFNVTSPWGTDTVSFNVI